MTDLSPVKTNEREIFMDVLRGFAILGIFIANLRGFSFWQEENAGLTSSMLLPVLDRKMHFLHHMFIEGKFYSIFSFLFGWGIALQVFRSQSNGVRSLFMIRRRLAVMLFLGAFHLLLWTGDIVFFYGLVGFLLLFFVRYRDKTLLVTGIVLILSPVLLYALKMNFLFLNAPVQILYALGDQMDRKLTGVTDEATFKIFVKQAGWLDILKSNISGFFFRYADLFFQSRLVKVLGMMLIGMAFGRSNFYRNIAQHKKILYQIIAFGCIVGLPANYMLAHYMQARDDSYYDLKLNGLYQTIAYALGVAVLAATYISLLMLLFQTGAGKKYLGFLAPVGKMAFTNYIMHSIIGSLVFYNAGLGFMGKVGPVYYTLFALIVFIFQVIFSTFWLRYFNYGPVEWVWRSATYGKWQSMRKNLYT